MDRISFFPSFQRCPEEKRRRELAIDVAEDFSMMMVVWL
jgi:hypothetical protein